MTSVHKKSPLSHAWLSLVSLPPLSHVAEELPILHESGAVVVIYTVVTNDHSCTMYMYEIFRREGGGYYYMTY